MHLNVRRGITLHPLSQVDIIFIGSSRVQLNLSVRRLRTEYNLILVKKKIHLCKKKFML